MPHEPEFYEICGYRCICIFPKLYYEFQGQGFLVCNAFCVILPGIDLINECSPKYRNSISIWFAKQIGEKCFLAV